MLNWVEDLNWNISLMSPSQLVYSDLTDENAGFKITSDDVSIDPNYFGKNHEQSRSAVVEWVTLTDRRLCVIKNDKVDENEKPLVFHSVAERISKDRNYLPRSLKGVKHRIYLDSGLCEVKEFEGYARHKENAAHYMRRMDVGDDIDVIAFAHNKYNHTGVLIEKGATYTIQVKPHEGGDQKWRDAGISCDAEGWNREEEHLGWKEIAIQGMEPFRREPDADWFCLIGTINDTDDNNFIIGKETTLEADTSGELCLYANDLTRFYGNNFGKLIVSVTRTA